MSTRAVLSQPGWNTYGNVGGVVDPGTGYDVEPFTPASGSTVDLSANYNWDNNPNAPLNFWLNPYFSFATTNEVDFARTYANGAGTSLFEVDTGLEAPGLGCGQAVADGGTTTPDCWLVVVPRGTPAQENPTNLTGDGIVSTSPLTPQAWANRIQIPLSFNPVGSNCSLSATPEQVIGSELAASAFSSWEPALCAQPKAPVVSYIQNNDDAARSNITSPTFGSVGMSVFTDPIDPSKLASGTSVLYAPLTASGVTVAFNVERVPITEPDGSSNASELADSGSRVENIYLTPRLVAKLLTESYESQFRGLRLSTAPAAYSWVKTNPISLLTDPDFLQYNPEFSLLGSSNLIDAGNVIVEEGSSDAATELWNWVLADPAAKAWLSGQPDPWGMTVNPYYSTTASTNPSGTAFATPVPESYPKSDPYCENTHSIVGVGATAGPARPLCIQDWSPYVQSMKAGAVDAATANDGAKTTLNTSATPDTAWGANGPQIPGQDLVLTVTSTDAAARYGLQTASLSQDGDDGASPTFIAPTSTSILAGIAAMAKSSVPGVLAPDPTTTARGAYPLSMLTYAAINPATLTAANKTDYADLLNYAAGAGQATGPQPGQLPSGYVPLPSALDAQTVTTAKALVAPAVATTPPATSTTSTSSAGSSGSSTPPPSGSTDGSNSSYGFLPQGNVSSLFSRANHLFGPTNGSTTTATVSHPVAKAKALGASQLSAVRSPYIPIGAVRWAMPFVLFIGVLAAAAALVSSFFRRRGTPSELSDDAPASADEAIDETPEPSIA